MDKEGICVWCKYIAHIYIVATTSSYLNRYGWTHVSKLYYTAYFTISKEQCPWQLNTGQCNWNYCTMSCFLHNQTRYMLGLLLPLMCIHCTFLGLLYGWICSNSLHILAYINIHAFRSVFQFSFSLFGLIDECQISKRSIVCVVQLL